MNRSSRKFRRHREENSPCGIGLERTTDGFRMVVAEGHAGHGNSRAYQVAETLSEAFKQDVDVLSDQDFSTWWDKRPNKEKT